MLLKGCHCFGILQTAFKSKISITEMGFLKLRVGGYTSLFFLTVMSCVFIMYLTSQDISLTEEKLHGNALLMKVSNVLESDSMMNWKKVFPVEEKRSRNFTENEPRLILIVSFWRSGSSWLGRLISKTPNTFYLYEPIHMLIPNFYQDIGNNISDAIIRSTLKQLFHCGLTDKLYEHFVEWREMYPDADDDVQQFEIAKNCASADYRVIKTVRMSLGAVEEMLMHPSLSNLKVIYLVRDPRGTMNSVQSLKNVSIVANLPMPHLCSRLHNDVIMLPLLQKAFPRRLFFLRYEDIAIDPFTKAKELWRFVDNDESAELPFEWFQFLNYSQAIKNFSDVRKTPFAIYKKSTQDWQMWRATISEDVLADTQQYCGDVIKTLGYRNFGNLKSVRNLSRSVIKEKNCTTVPCHVRKRGRV